ncbi:DUF418 domain-containing protein [Erythrobacter dokdonensis]|uniref:DUF418 domain-containing protein n=1 Tax=Erythrobacter dokdonensis DSW-74 TaxID=1300349 RepID=A0A1A7BBM4_9SPHN|nr:DUF418 domain-containing protein [Erythrobacter dokdonensis]OBV09899.1 DUF418 domain-containing protein [Erythrobacter dokdonensis DSW-74]
MMAPPHSPDRILALDALRGIAVIGIVGMNVHAFALPGPAYYNPLSYGAVDAADYRVWLASFIFIEDKFRTLFAMLFGAGCLILIERGGERPWRAHYARMIVLFAIGLVHAALLASNDILRAYALAGLALPLLAGLSARALVTVGLGLLMVHLALGLTAFGSVLVDFHVKHSGSDALLWAERQFGRDPAAIAALLEQGREGFAERVVRRSLGIPAQLATLFASLPLNLAAVALGMGLWKGGMLKGEWRTFHLQRLAAGCALASLPVLLGLAGWLVVQGFPAALVGPVALVISAPFDTLLGMAYAALAMAFLARDSALTRRLAAVGRLSLTNYLMTSVILAAIFASWGLGLFGEVTRWQALVLGLVPVVAMLVWSPAWVARLGQGPFERLWRAGAKALS